MTTNDAAFSPWNLTKSVLKPDPEKPVPRISTSVEDPPTCGVNEVIVGGGITVNGLDVVAVPCELVTAIFPVVVPAATVAVISVSETTVKFEAFLPPNV